MFLEAMSVYPHNALHKKLHKRFRFQNKLENAVDGAPSQIPMLKFLTPQHPQVPPLRGMT